MWARSLHICTFAGLVDKANRSLPGREKHSIQIFFTGADRDIHGLLAHSRPHLSFTDGEERRGLTALQQIGIPDDSRFICFCARDSAYLHDTSPVRDLRYHDYRDSNIENYIPAAEEMTHRGYVAMRMGAIVKKALTTTNPMVIDYANKYRSDFLDIFLSAKCYFFICDTNGLHAIPKVFRRPIAYVNIIPLEHAPTGSPDDLFIPKRLWQRGERRFLTFRQMLDATANMLPTSEYFKTLGIESVENTPDEITALTIEMDERLKGTWQTTEEDEELQRRFWELFRRRELSKIFLSRIGAVFLRQNQASLE
jgi:putative glycosyltransferase (TIGR04372 family)